MKRKLLVLLLALAMMINLISCASAPAETAKPSDAAAEPEAAASAGTEAEAAGNPIKLVFACNKNEAEDGGQVVKHFCDYVTEASNGEISFEIFWGGTMCSMPEEFEIVSTGAADMCALNQLPFGSKIPLAQFPNGSCNGAEGTVAYANEVLFTNEASSALVSKNFEDNNLHYVGYSLNGSSGYYCNFEAYQLEDMAGKKFGTGKSGALQKEYGLNVVSMDGSAGYDSLQRGVVDCTDFTMGAAYSNSWDEVTKYWVFYGLCSFGNFFTINLDTWNKLTPEQQAIIEKAGVDTLEFSINQVKTNEEEIVKAVEADGITVTFVEGEKKEEFAAKSFRIDCENALVNSQSAGVVEDMKTVLGAASDALGIDVSDILAKY